MDDAESDSKHAILLAKSHVTESMYECADEFVRDFQENFGVLGTGIQSLKTDPPKPTAEFTQALLYWCIVLGVLALDSFKSLIVLLKANRLRAAVMLSRSLIDYSVRLRYYVEQAKTPVAGLARNPKIDPKYIRDQVHAYRDWFNADTKLVGILGLYPAEVIPDEARSTILEELARENQRYDQRFNDMLKVAAPSNRRSEQVYHDATLATWLMASAPLLHGDQAVITDVIRRRGETTEAEIDSPSALPRTLLMEAVSHMEDLLQSFAMVHGWNIGEYKWRLKWARLFVSAMVY
jgi:hypothetical protein